MKLRALVHSERPRPPQTRKVRPLDPEESVSIVIQLRRRPHAPPVPSLEHWANTPFPKRRYLTPQEFAGKYGASPEDIGAVSAYLKSHDIRVLDANIGSRMLRMSVTAAQVKAAFGVDLASYEAGGEQHHGFDGPVHVPEDLFPAIETVLGLDNRARFRHAGGVPGLPFLNPTEVASLYGFPTSGAAGQTIAIISLSNQYLPTDITGFYSAGGPGAGLNAPNIVFPDPLAPPSYSITNASGQLDTDEELTMDIEIASAIAQGATIAVYPGNGDETLAGALGVAVNQTNPVTNVITMSFDGLEGTPPAPPNSTDPFMNTFNSLIADAAALGITVLAVTGDRGANGGAPQGQLHLYYPGSDPGVISCGGTMVTNVVGSAFDETTWNDSALGKDANLGATGGGVSIVFPLQSWQLEAGVPQNPDTGAQGRGIPDISGNASGDSPYNIFFNSIVTSGAGTSAVAPLYAGLIAVVNAALGSPVGFITPFLYRLAKDGIFQDIDDDSNNQIFGDLPAAPYLAVVGWDACTGWGSVDGEALLAKMQNLKHSPVVAIGSGTEVQTVGGLDDGWSTTFVYRFGHLVKVIHNPPVFIDPFGEHAEASLS